GQLRPGTGHQGEAGDHDEGGQGEDRRDVAAGSGTAGAPGGRGGVSGRHHDHSFVTSETVSCRLRPAVAAARTNVRTASPTSTRDGGWPTVTTAPSLAPQ